MCCLNCGLRTSRRIIQNKLESLNGAWIEKYVQNVDSQQFADGDADTGEGHFSKLRLLSEHVCYGML